MNVKVKLQSEQDDIPGKVEYFNNIDWWDTASGTLDLYRYTDQAKQDHLKIASIKYWHWIKIDE